MLSEQEIEKQAQQLIEEFIKKILETIDLSKVSEDYASNVALMEDKVFNNNDEEFRKIFLSNAKSEKGYIVVEKARWWKR
jgi:pantoate kinase